MRRTRVGGAHVRPGEDRAERFDRLLEVCLEVELPRVFHPAGLRARSAGGERASEHEEPEGDVLSISQVAQHHARATPDNVARQRLRYARRVLRLPVPAALTAVLVLCSCDAGSYQISVAFEPSSLVADAVRVELAVIADCDAQTLGSVAAAPVLTTALRRMDVPMPLGALPPGSYGLYGRATNAECTVMAAGCAPIVVEAGGSGLLEVTLRAQTGVPCPSGTSCSVGECVAGGDAGVVDAGPRDAGVCTADGECDDGDACTAEACVAGSCVYVTTDADGDLHSDATCPALGDLPNDDCDDTDDAVFPGATEVCNGVDDDCEGGADEDFDCASGSTRACSSCGFGEQACDDTCTFGACGPLVGADTVALYSFDAEPDPMAFSDRASDHDGTVTVDATWGDGPFGCSEALGLGGTGFGEAADSPDWDLDVGTVSLWVRFDADGAAYGVFSRDETDTDTPGHLTISRRDTDLLRARIQDVVLTTERCAPVTSGHWIEVFVRFGAPDFELVIDGVTADGCDTNVVTTGIAGNDNPVVIGAHQINSMAGSSDGATAFLEGAVDHVRVSSRRADPAMPEIASFVLVDAEADVSLGPLGEGAVIDRAALPGFTLRVTTDPGTVGSVTLELDAEPVATEGIPPYSFGDSMGDFDPLALAPGEHTLRATAYTGSSASGTAGPSRTLTFTVR